MQLKALAFLLLASAYMVGYDTPYLQRQTETFVPALPDSSQETSDQHCIACKTCSMISVHFTGIAYSDGHKHVYPAVHTSSLHPRGPVKGVLLDQGTHTKTDRMRVIRTHPYCGNIVSAAMFISKACKNPLIAPLSRLRISTGLVT